MTTGCASAEFVLCSLPASFLAADTPSYTPVPGIFAPETGKKQSHASNKRLACYDGKEIQGMSKDKFIYVSILTSLFTNPWNLAPQTFALLDLWYIVTWGSFDSSTLTLEQKLRHDALHI